MSLRMKVVNEKNIKLSDIQKIVKNIDPFDGAQEFLEWARSKFQVTIVSDTFYELAWPLVEKLGYPSIICHNMTVENDKITGYKLRQPNNKQKVIKHCNHSSLKFLHLEILIMTSTCLILLTWGYFFRHQTTLKRNFRISLQPHLMMS